MGGTINGMVRGGGTGGAPNDGIVGLDASSGAASGSGIKYVSCRGLVGYAALLKLVVLLIFDISTAFGVDETTAEVLVLDSAFFNWRCTDLVCLANFLLRIVITEITTKATTTTAAATEPPMTAEETPEPRLDDSQPALSTEKSTKMPFVSLSALAEMLLQSVSIGTGVTMPTDSVIVEQGDSIMYCF